MPKGTNQKLKLYYLAKIMVMHTDAMHGLTMSQIKEELETYGITADRKSLYDDMEALGLFGIDIVGEQDGKYYIYYVVKKGFELEDLKLLLDAVWSSKYVTEKKANELTRKLTGLVSEYEAADLKRQTQAVGRIKNMNESIYAALDEIHWAMSNNHQVEFEFMQWNLQKKQERKGEDLCIVSPWAVIWADETCYLIAYDEEDKEIKQFNMDKIQKVESLEAKRNGKDNFKQFDLATASKTAFSVYGGNNEKVKLRFNIEKLDAVLDKFGKESECKSAGKGFVEATVDVAVNDGFYGWMFANGKEVKIVSPKKVKDEFREKLRETLEQFD